MARTNSSPYFISAHLSIYHPPFIYLRSDTSHRQFIYMNQTIVSGAISVPHHLFYFSWRCCSFTGGKWRSTNPHRRNIFPNNAIAVLSLSIFSMFWSMGSSTNGRSFAKQNNTNFAPPTKGIFPYRDLQTSPHRPSSRLPGEPVNAGNSGYLDCWRCVARSRPQQWPSSRFMLSTDRRPQRHSCTSSLSTHRFGLGISRKHV